MNTFLLFGISIVNIALLFYTAAFIIAVRNKLVSRLFFSVLFAGVLFDISATTLMIVGSTHGVITLHGIIGYTSLGAMIAEVVNYLILVRKKGFGKEFSKKSLKIFAFVYLYWVLVYVTGAVLIMLRN